MAQSILIPPSHPEFNSALNRRLAEITAELDGLRVTGATIGDSTQNNTGSPSSLRNGTHAQRLGVAPGTLPVGTTWYETDRTVHYVVSQEDAARIWRYVGGAMKGTLAPNQKPTDLDAVGDKGFRFYSTDFNHTYEWRGAVSATCIDATTTPTGWDLDWAGGAEGQLFVRMFIFIVLVPGWHLADGTTVPRSTRYGLSGPVTLPNLVGSYPKFAAAHTGTVIAAVAPVLSGDMDDAAGHTHTATTAAVNTFGASVGAYGVPGGGPQVFTPDHTHTVPGQSVTTSPSAVHKHTKGTLAVGATAEPAHMDLMPHVRL